MSTILVPNNEKTCTSYKLDNDASSLKQTDNNLDLIVTFLNFPQATNNMGDNEKNLLEQERPMPHLVPLQNLPSSTATLVMDSTVHQNSATSISEQANELLSNDAEPPTITILQTSAFPPVPSTDINNTHDNDNENANELNANNDEVEIEYEMQESEEEEEELTNLTWLTELRNQSITWPGSINPTILDDNAEATAGGSSENVAVKEQMNEIATAEKLTSGNNKNMLKMGAKTSLLNMTNLSVNTKDGQRQLSGCNNAKPISTQAQAQVKRPTPAERYQIFMDKVKRDLQEYEQSAINYQTDTTEKPPFNYSHIIGMAMLEKGRVTLQQICSWIEAKFAFFRVRKKWNNSIRHNLSLHHCFRKINRNKYEKGKGGYWELGVDPKKCDRKRIRNRKSANSQRNKKANTTQNNQNSNSSYADLQEAASAVAGLIETTTTSHNLSDDIDMELDVQLTDGLEQAEQLLLDDLDVQQNIDISSNQQQQQQQLQSNLERQLQQEEAFIANVLANCIEMDAAAHDVAEATNSSHELQAAMAASVPHMPHYQLGTVIISASSDDMAGTLNSFIYNHGGHDNNNSSNGNSEYCQTQQHKILYREDEIPPASENVIVSSFLDPHSNITNPNRPNVIVEQLEPYYSVISASATTLVTTNGDCTSVAGEHFRPYIDGIDEAFQYLRSMDHNRSEDLLDNLLDISVSDY